MFCAILFSLSARSKYSSTCNYDHFRTDIRATCDRRFAQQVTASYYLRCVIPWRYVSIIRGAQNLRITNMVKEKETQTLQGIKNLIIFRHMTYCMRLTSVYVSVCQMLQDFHVRYLLSSSTQRFKIKCHTYNKLCNS